MEKMKVIRYTAEEKEFLRGFIRGHSYKEIAEEFTRRFRPITIEQATAFCKNNKIQTGRTGQFRKGQPTWNKGKHYCAGGRSAETRFKKGNIPKQWRPLGSERVNKDGYIEIKVKEPRTWMLKHRYIWQQHHGEIPQGSMVVFKDGNRMNTDISNLLLITRGLNARLTKMGLQGAREAGAIEQAVMVARLEEKIATEAGRSRHEHTRNR